MLIAARQPNREYMVDAAHGKLWILTNDDHVNFRVAEARSTSPANGTTVIAGSDRDLFARAVRVLATISR